MHDMVAERPDWCISRQRFWGVPLIVFYCESCGKQLQAISKRCATCCRSSSAKAPTPGTRTPPKSCFRRERNAPAAPRSGERKPIFSTSGSIPAPLTSPCSAKRTAYTGPRTFISKAPISFAAGSKARCSSRSARAATRPTARWSRTAGRSTKKARRCRSRSATPCIPRKSAKNGAPICCACGSPRRITPRTCASPDAMMTQLAEAYRKIRNTFRFALSNLFDFDPARDSCTTPICGKSTPGCLRRTGALVGQCNEWYKDFEFHRVYHAIHDFCSVDLSAFYFDVLKDRLYTFAPNNRGRRSAQTAVYHISARAGAPDRADSGFHFRGSLEIICRASLRAARSVHMASFPVANIRKRARRRAAKNWDRSAQRARRSVESARSRCAPRKQSPRTLEARVTSCGSRRAGRRCCEICRAAFRLFSSFRRSKSPRRQCRDRHASRRCMERTAQSASSAPHGKKCERCWNYSTHVGESADYPTSASAASPPWKKSSATPQSGRERRS